MPKPPAKQKSSKKTTTPLPSVQITSTGTVPADLTVAAPVISSGSIVGETLGYPALLPPTSPHAVLNNMVARDSLDPKEELEPLSPTITGLRDTVKAMSLGEDISPFKEHIQQIAANQPEKGEVVRAYVNQANHELIADLVEMRHNAIRHIRRASRRPDVSLSEGLVVWRMVNEQLPELVKNIGVGDKAVDTVTVVEKIDYHRQQVERSVHKRWEGTTPQGRELIRKKLWKLEREVKAAQGIFPPGLYTPPAEEEPPEDPPVDSVLESIPEAV